MVAELGKRITGAVQQMRNAKKIDDQVLNECLNDITIALLQSDVQSKLVRDMQTNIKKIVNLKQLPAGLNKLNFIKQAIFDELCKMMDPGVKPSFTPKKGETSVVMFVGLQGCGKTTTCAKYAYYHQKKGWKPALVCADTFRAGAFDQLKQNASKANVPFYGSYSESDPVKIAVEGVERFKKENCDLIIVDTSSGRHKQEVALFEEMRHVFEATKPDLVIFVIDSTIGQAAFDQAQAFNKQGIAAGAVIITKMDGHAKGGGALSAVAATRSPVIFIGTGEHMYGFEVFDVKPFLLSRLSGKRDWSGIREVFPMDKLHKLSEGSFTLRMMRKRYERYELSTLTTGPLSQVFSMLRQQIAKTMPKESQEKIKRYMTILDSMTNEELDSPNTKQLSESRIMRIAEGSGCRVEEVMELLEEYKRCAMSWSMCKGKICNKGEKKSAHAQHVISKAFTPQMHNRMDSWTCVL